MNHDSLSEEKRQVPGQFDQVAARYDLMTALNPGYRKHLRWSARRLNLRPGAQVLDLCCGTGLSTEALVRTWPDATIDALDASAGMLDVARTKPWAKDVRLIHGNAMKPEEAGLTGPYDGILMAYGIRNMPDPDEALVKIYQLLAPGGVVCFHEYSVADSALSRLLWRLVIGSVVVPAGLLTSGTASIYRYLSRSVLDFDGVSAFEARLRRIGYTAVRTLACDGWQHGIVHSFVAERPIEASS